jgi:hypothetical protein
MKRSLKDAIADTIYVAHHRALCLFRGHDWHVVPAATDVPVIYCTNCLRHRVGDD